jgi:hypothetical protein
MFSDGFNSTDTAGGSQFSFGSKTAETSPKCKSLLKRIPSVVRNVKLCRTSSYLCLKLSSLS